MRFLVFLLAAFLLLATASQAQSSGVSNVIVNATSSPNSYNIATLPASGGATFDHLHFIATIGGWGGVGATYLDLFFANRGGFVYSYTARGATLSTFARISAYQNSDGSVGIYLIVQPGYSSCDYTVLENVQETVPSSPTDMQTTTPAGTLVFDSSSAAYPPATFSDFANNFTVAGKIVTGASVTGLPQNLLAPLTIASSAADGQGSASQGLLFVDTTFSAQQAWTTAAIYAQGAPGYNGSLVFATDGDNYPDFGVTEKMRLDQNGNLGLGTPTPGARLEVNGGITITRNSGGSITFADGSSQSTAGGGSSSLISQSGSNLSLGASGTNNGVVTVNGILQVSGTTTPTVTSQGGYLGWNALTGSTGETDFINNQGLGQGGFAFFNTPNSGTPLTTLMFLSGGGQLGIGTTSPGAPLEVNGNLKLTSGSGGSLIFADGSVQSIAYKGNICAGGDYAESVNVSGDRKHYEPGDVMVLDASSGGHFQKSSSQYSTLVAGIYSTKPGIVGRRQTIAAELSDSEIPMAMVGIVPTKVSTENGPIKIGDLLVTSSREGYAMKGTDKSLMMGAILGKALSTLTSGEGVIEVLVSLQ